MGLLLVPDQVLESVPRVGANGKEIVSKRRKAAVWPPLELNILSPEFPIGCPNFINNALIRAVMRILVREGFVPALD